MNSTGQNTESSSTTTCVQAAADSVADASNKGQAQSSTPPEWGRVLSRPLNPFRPVITDLTCGNGNLLHAASNGDAILLGCDIQNEEAGSQISEHLVIADLTAFYPLLQSVDWQGDCFVLNPPWDLHWYRERLEGLARSGRETVRLAWRATDARLGADTLDSTLATLMIALDRMSAYGEGLLIANEATLQRLLFNGPHGALAQHVWAHLVVEGQPLLRDGQVQIPGGFPDRHHLVCRRARRWRRRQGPIPRHHPGRRARVLRVPALRSLLPARRPVRHRVPPHGGECSPLGCC